MAREVFVFINYLTMKRKRKYVTPALVPVELQVENGLMDAAISGTKTMNVDDSDKSREMTGPGWGDETMWDETPFE